MSKSEESSSPSAKEGHPQAIAALINKSLNAKGITVKAALSYDCLTLILESENSPPQQAVIEFLKKGLRNLKPQNINKVIVRGKIAHQPLIVWQDSFSLAEQPDANSRPLTPQLTNQESAIATRSTQRKSKVLIKPAKSVSDFTLAEIVQIIIDFAKSRNGERSLIVLGTFFVTSIYWTNINSKTNTNTTTASTPPASQSPPLPFVSQTYDLTGTITLLDSEIGGTNDYCYGTGGYEDIQSEMPVTVRDGSGNILATGKTGSGSHPVGAQFASVQCVFQFSIPDLPKVDFYAITVGRRGELNYSFDELKAKAWKVSLSLGT